MHARLPVRDGSVDDFYPLDGSEIKINNRKAVAGALNADQAEAIEINRNNTNTRGTVCRENSVLTWRTNKVACQIVGSRFLNHKRERIDRRAGFDLVERLAGRSGRPRGRERPRRNGFGSLPKDENKRGGDHPRLDTSSPVCVVSHHFLLIESPPDFETAMEIKSLRCVP